MAAAGSADVEFPKDRIQRLGLDLPLLDDYFFMRQLRRQAGNHARARVRHHSAAASAEPCC